MNKSYGKAIALLLAILTATLFCNRKEKGAEGLESGKNIYEANCAACHGINGEGDGPGAAALDPKPRNYKKDGFKYGSSLEDVTRTIKEGLLGTAMTGFEEVLTDEQVDQVARYVKDLADPTID